MHTKMRLPIYFNGFNVFSSVLENSVVKFLHTILLPWKGHSFFQATYFFYPLVSAFLTLESHKIYTSIILESSSLILSLFRFWRQMQKKNTVYFKLQLPFPVILNLCWRYCRNFSNKSVTNNHWMGEKLLCSCRWHYFTFSIQKALFGNPQTQTNLKDISFLWCGWINLHGTNFCRILLKVGSTNIARNIWPIVSFTYPI